MEKKYRLSQLATMKYCKFKIKFNFFPIWNTYFNNFPLISYVLLNAFVLLYIHIMVHGTLFIYNLFGDIGNV